LAKIGHLLYTKLKHDERSDASNETRFTMRQHMYRVYLEEDEDQGRTTLQKLYNSILKYSEQHARCRFVGTLLGWSLKYVVSAPCTLSHHGTSVCACTAAITARIGTHRVSCTVVAPTCFVFFCVVF
jgi:hypothetical protein